MDDFDERIEELQNQIDEAKRQIAENAEKAFIHNATRQGVVFCLAILRETPWESATPVVASMVRPAQQNLARALIEMDK